VISLDR